MTSTLPVRTPIDAPLGSNGAHLLNSSDIGMGVDVYTLSDAEFGEFARLILEWTGVRIGPSKKAMLLARLGMRLRQLHMVSIGEYLAYLVSRRGLEEEKNHFIDVVTTHHTAFFRESEHFSFLAREAPQLVRAGGTLEVLSAACSTGEEVWSIGMTLAEALGHRRFIVHGCDISLRALHAARRAIYPEESLNAVPVAQQKRWFMRSRERERRVVRVVPELRELASFSLVNLSESTLHIGRRFEAIFLRNVLIYFEREMQQKILTRIVALLSSGGWLFVGTAESAEGFGLPIERIQQSVYRRHA